MQWQAKHKLNSLLVLFYFIFFNWATVDRIRQWQKRETGLEGTGKWAITLATTREWKETENKAVAVQILFYFSPSNTIVRAGGMSDLKAQKMFKS